MADEKSKRVTAFSGIRLSPESWLEKRKYPMPGSAQTDKDLNSLHKDDVGLSIGTWLEEVGKMTVSDIIDEYVMLKLSDVSTIGPAAGREGKNRYNDLELFDKTRIVLNDGLPGDYIHASYVDGYLQRRAYISTQAPTPETVVDFWRMIWQEEAVVIVMLTKIFEGVSKCVAYWPGRQGGKMRFGPFFIKSFKVQQRTTYTVTEMIIKDLRTGLKRVVVHFLYTDWPDHCVPVQLTQFLHFMERVRLVQYYQLKRNKCWDANLNGPPIVVHCSAGIGRTGTFQTMDICFRRFIATGKVDIPNTVKKIRQQRAGSVQSNEQYIFIYVVVLHMIKADNMLDSGKINPEKMIEGW